MNNKNLIENEVKNNKNLIENIGASSIYRIWFFIPEPPLDIAFDLRVVNNKLTDTDNYKYTYPSHSSFIYPDLCLN